MESNNAVSSKQAKRKRITFDGKGMLPNAKFIVDLFNDSPFMRTGLSAIMFPMDDYYGGEDGDDPATLEEKKRQSGYHRLLKCLDGTYEFPREAFTHLRDYAMFVLENIDVKEIQSYPSRSDLEEQMYRNSPYYRKVHQNRDFEHNRQNKDQEIDGREATLKYLMEAAGRTREEAEKILSIVVGKNTQE